jgi:hypothetical protein
MPDIGSLLVRSIHLPLTRHLSSKSFLEALSHVRRGVLWRSDFNIFSQHENQEIWIENLEKCKKRYERLRDQFYGSNSDHQGGQQQEAHDHNKAFACEVENPYPSSISLNSPLSIHFFGLVDCYLGLGPTADRQRYESALCHRCGR